MSRVHPGRVAFHVEGQPAPGGSKSAFFHKYTKRIVVTDAGGKRTKEWRKAVAAAARLAMAGNDVLKAPIGLTITFRMTRPKSHLTSNGELRAGAPVVPTSKPDLTKLLRSTEDAMTGIVWGDDSHICEQRVCRFYALPSEPAGAHITAYHVHLAEADGISRERQ